MAMSNAKKIEEDCLKEDVDLNSVKQLIEEQEPNYGLRNCDAPLFQWPILKAPIDGVCKSELFIVGRDVYVGQLALNTSKKNNWKLTLDLKCLMKDGTKQAGTFHSFQQFICKLKYYDCYGSCYEKCTMSTNTFISDAEKNEIHFRLNCDLNWKKATLEVYVEPSTTSNYVSPLDNAVVGKIERFSEKRSLVCENRMLVVSPRFVFGSADQKMIARFWRRNESEENEQGLTVILHVIGKKKAPVRPPFPLKVSFTIFNQKESGNDFTKKVVLREDENKCKYPIVLALNRDLETLGCLENDTLYYRVVVEPFNFALPDETAK